MNNLIPINYDNNRQTVSAKALYDFLELDKSQWSRWHRQNIEMDEYFTEGTDYMPFDIMSNGNQTKDFQITIEMAKELSMLARTPKGKQARQYFIEVEKQYRQVQQKPVTIVDALAQTVQALQEQESRIKLLETTQQAIKDAVISEPDNWREDIRHKLNKIAQCIGENKFREVRSESYKLLEQRAGVNLDRRLFNLKARLMQAGNSKTIIDKANKMDCVEEDKKLREIYSKIVSEYLIKYAA